MNRTQIEAKLAEPVVTLTDFLLARIAEDEEWAKHRDIVTFGLDDSHMNPARVLAECEAKRRIVQRCAEVMGESDPRASLDDEGWASLMWEMMYDLATVYVDHPDYREEWRP